MLDERLAMMEQQKLVQMLRQAGANGWPVAAD